MDVVPCSPTLRINDGTPYTALSDTWYCVPRQSYNRKRHSYLQSVNTSQLTNSAITLNQSRDCRH